MLEPPLVVTTGWESSFNPNGPLDLWLVLSQFQEGRDVSHILQAHDLTLEEAHQRLTCYMRNPQL